MHGNSLSLTVVVTPAGCHGLLLLLHHPHHLQHLGLALRCLLFHLCHLYLFSFLCLALVPFFLPCFYSLRHFIYSLTFSSALSLSAHRFLSSSILSFISLARPFHCLSFKCFLSWYDQSQHFRGLREVLVCFLFYYSFSITVLLFHFYHLKRALLKYSYSEISMFSLFHPQKGIIPLSQLENFRYSWLLVPL